MGRLFVDGNTVALGEGGDQFKYTEDSPIVNPTVNMHRGNVIIEWGEEQRKRAIGVISGNTITFGEELNI